MKGQKLFIRPIESGDSEAVARFLESMESVPPARSERASRAVTVSSSGETPDDCGRDGRSPQAASGLLGKLVGELVAVVEIHLTPDAIQIDNVVVARDLRRKRIGRFMLDEVEHLAVKMDRSRLIVSEPETAHEFFSRTGFEREGARWIRYVRSQGAERASR